MTLTGHCYCGHLSYRAEDEPLMRLQCHCRECQYLSGGGPNVLIVMPGSAFTYTAGSPKQFTRPDLAAPVTRDFCPECGTHILTRSPRMPGLMLIKVGTLDDPGIYGMPDRIINLADKQSFHCLPDGIPTFEKRPAS
ncbi:hypothetical protein ASG35_12965 [Burkholderia sp. Leaf177]|uniref:GFA family protein n=1 Tax=Burkholderia sp. Leaf177 TaxID=1736287 RepID=UPI0006F69177|nr:GFA family protein [Burkholderia sp. Leaf177]KQR77162.1 hypothetical protein ASG35_12965 [Burkholderia sp. Leaf177]